MHSGFTARLLVVGLALLPLSALQAQTGARIGPMVGIVNSSFRGDDAGDAGSRTSFLAGGFVWFPLSRQFALEPELLYVRKGAETTIEDVTGTLALDYIEIPLLAQIRFPSQDVTPYILLGPAFSFRTGCKLSIESGEAELSADCEAEGVDVGIKDTDFSLIGGLGLEVQNFMVSLRYDHGLSQLPSEGDGSVYNRAIAITFGYAFRLGN